MYLMHHGTGNSGSVWSYQAAPTVIQKFVLRITAIRATEITSTTTKQHPQKQFACNKLKKKLLWEQTFSQYDCNKL